MKLFTILVGLVGFNPLTLAADKPSVPLSSQSRWIVDTAGNRVKFRCVDWAGHMETNVPEGLDKQSIDYVADWIAKEGFNCVRLTYSIDMALNQTVKVEDAFRNGAQAAGVDEGAVMSLYNQAVEKNSFLSDAAVIDVFDAVQSALWDRGVMTIIDNHVSRAQWCCDIGDGNGWWADAPGYSASNSQYFITENWQNGLHAMAQWASSRPGIVAMSLRNELRADVTQFPSGGDVWLDYMPRAAGIIHSANPDILIVVGGINGGTDLTPLRDDSNMDMGDWAGKHVWEAHDYSYTVTTPSLGNCDVSKTEYGGLWGFVLEQDNANTGPLWLSEFGVGMQGGDNEGLSDDDFAYLTCLVSYMEGNDADWALWAIQGSYYIRQGNVAVEETWGALDSSWTDWRNPNFKSMLGNMWQVTQGPGI